MSDKLPTYTLTGRIDYAKVHEADHTFNKDNGEYSVTLLLEGDLLAEMEQIFERHNISEMVTNPSNSTIVPRIRPNKDGIPTLTIKRKEFNLQKEPAKIEVSDSRCLPLSSRTLVGNGSLANVQFFVTTNSKNKAGSLKLAGVQVLELVEFTKKSGFEPQDGGYKAEPVSEEVDQGDSPF